ncbi:magnesium transporter [Hirschia litorea]|uniref:Magnesium transporter MgtE n=1 Tax=Hirschia litorea TaxID=1199156 RepID=A0ABW2IGI0_9PROT
MTQEINEVISPHEELLSETSGVDEETVDLFIDLVEAGARDGLIVAMEDYHPADMADVFEQMPRQTFNTAVKLLDDMLPGDTIAELSEDLRIDALNALSDKVVADVLGELDSDDAALLASDLEDDRQERVFEQINATDRAAIETSLNFDEETAGRLMQRDFVAAPEFWTVGQAIDHMRSTEDLPEPFFEVYLVDPGFRFVGAVPLSVLICAPRETLLSDLGVDISAAVKPDMDQEEVAYIFQQYNLASVPVLDEAGRLTGMITVDDMVDVIHQENKEDMLALSGVRDGGSYQSVWDAVQSRAPWLGVNLFTAFIVSGAISIFEDTLTEIIALAVLMPVVAALGGNAGSQALAVTVRAIAERDMQGARAGRAVRREFLTAMFNGVVFSVGVGLIALVWFKDPQLSGVISVAMFSTFIWAGVSGVLVPIGLEKLGADPAVASSVFVLTSVDIVAFSSFLGLATAVLM